MRERKGVVWDTMIPWIIAIAVLVLVGLLVYLLKDQLSELASRFRNTLRSNG